MLAALCLAMVFAISLSSYIALCYTSLVASTRSVLAEHSLEMAEAGIEQALYAENSGDWSLWTLAGGNATANLTMTAAGLAPTSGTPAALNFGNGATGTVTITVSNYQTSARTITSQGIMLMPNGSGSNPGAVVTVSRTLTFSGASPGASGSAPLFVNAVAATSGRVRFRAAGALDSYNSNPSPGVYASYNPSAPGFSAVVVSQDVGSSTSTVSLGNATVKGFASGFSSYSPGTTNWLSYANAQLVGASTPSSTSIDSGRILTTPVPYQPLFPENLPTSHVNTSLPASCTTGGNYLNLPGGTIGSSSDTSPQIYDTNGITLTGGAPVYVNGPVVLIVYGNILISGTGGIVLATPNASLTIFEESGSVNLGGNGITNLNSLGTTGVPPLPKRVALVGTNDTYGTVVLSQTLPFYGVMYFPYMRTSVVGSVTIYGSIVGYSVSFQGSPSLHYDLALRSPGASSLDAAFTSVTAPITVGSLTASVP